MIGENGAFWFRYDPATRRLERRFLLDPASRTAGRARLAELGERIMREVPGAALASDQTYREADLAIDYCGDVPPLTADAVARIVAICEAAGATAKVSSIHVNAWFGRYDKLTMAQLFLRECCATDLDEALHASVFVGDSPNDAPMFAHFRHAVGVANVRRFAAGVAALPGWVARLPGGEGFAELADALLASRARD